MEYKDFRQLDYILLFLRLGSGFLTGVTCVFIINFALVEMFFQTLLKAFLVVKTLSHKWGIRDRFVLAFPTSDYGLLNAYSYIISCATLGDLPEKMRSIMEGWLS